MDLNCHIAILYFQQRVQEVLQDNQPETVVKPDRKVA